MKNDYNKSYAKIPKYEKVTKQIFQIFSCLVRKWLRNFGLGRPDMCRPSRPIFCFAQTSQESTEISAEFTGPFIPCLSQQDWNLSGRFKQPHSPSLYFPCSVGKTEMSQPYTITLMGGEIRAFIYYSSKWTHPNKCFCLPLYFVFLWPLTCKNQCFK